QSGVYLPYTVGLWDTARSLAEQTLEEIESAGVKEVIVLCREDAHAFVNVYSEIGVALPEGVRVVEYISWLWGAIEQGRLRLPRRDLGRVVYHDPCHTPRLRENAPARKVIEALTG